MYHPIHYVHLYLVIVPVLYCIDCVLRGRNLSYECRVCYPLVSVGQQLSELYFDCFESECACLTFPRVYKISSNLIAHAHLFGHLTDMLSPGAVKG